MTRKRRSRSLLMLLSGLAVSAQAQGAAADVLCGVRYENAAELAGYFDGNVTLKPLKTAPLFQAFAAAEPGKTWTLTREGHPAHFTVVCRQIVEIDGKLHVESTFACFAESAKCERLVADFKNLDAQMIEASKRETEERKAKKP